VLTVRVVAIGLVVLGALAVGAAGPDAPAPHPLTTAVAAGQHVRLETDHGPVHVWIPAGYHADGAATIAYVHGYYTDVDKAWTGHQLPEQFALAGINAVFIACAAPDGAREPVRWSSLGDLVHTAIAGAGVTPPMGPLVAMGHSGAYRTLVPWLEEPRLEHVVLVDANYDQVEPFRRWVDASSRHRLIDIGEDTLNWADDLARALTADGVPPIYVERFPPDERGWPDGIRDARFVSLRAQYSHMQLVQGGVVLPMVLRLLPVEVLADGAWKERLGDLPEL
jgi:hypothetical protein